MMKKTPRIGMAAIALSAGVFGLVNIGDVNAASAKAPQTQQVQAKDGHEEGEKPTLHDIMEEMASDYRSVRRQARDASKNDSTADLLAKLSANTMQAKELLPAMLESVPEAQRADLAKTYRVAMVKLTYTFLQAEEAILEDRNADAYQLVLAANEIKANGHEMFIPEDE